MFNKNSLLKTKNIIKVTTQLTKYLCMCAVYYYKNKVYAKQNYVYFLLLKQQAFQDVVSGVYDWN